MYAPLPAPSPLELPARPLPSAPPGVVVRGLLWLRHALRSVHDAVSPGELWVFDRVIESVLFDVLLALVRTGVIDALDAGPRSAAELAAELGLNADALQRTLRCCAAQGVVRLRGDRRFEHTPRSRALAGGRVGRGREFLLYFGSGSNQAAWHQFEHALRTGQSPFDHVHGMTVWQWFEAHADEREMFAHAMLGASAADAPVIAAAYPFARARVVCDVGGGRGTVLSELLLRYRHLRGVLAESEGVLASARALLGARGVLERTELVPTDFFERVPAGADVYLMKSVLHDWDDARSVQILEKVRAAAGRGARLLVVEALVEPDSRDPVGTGLDLQMMVACSGGRERGRAELARLLQDGGWALRRTFEYPTTAVLEASPA